MKRWLVKKTNFYALFILTLKKIPEIRVTMNVTKARLISMTVKMDAPIQRPRLPPMEPRREEKP